MKFEDFPIEQVAFITYQDLDIVMVDMLQSDIMPGGIKPFFFVRLRKALRYLGVDPSSIAELNFSNYQKYHDEIYNICDILYRKYSKEIISIYNNIELKVHCYHTDLIGNGIGEIIDLDD